MDHSGSATNKKEHHALGQPKTKFIHYFERQKEKRAGSPYREEHFGYYFFNFVVVGILFFFMHACLGFCRLCAHVSNCWPELWEAAALNADVGCLVVDDGWYLAVGNVYAYLIWPI